MLNATPRIKGKIRHYSHSTKQGSIVARSMFYLIDRTSAHSSTARQFRADQHVVEWLKQHRRSKPQMPHFEECFAALCRAGSISVDLSKIGEGDRIITGYELRASPILDRILSPATLTAAQKEKKVIEAMSADAYLKATPELQEQGVSPIFKRRFDQAVLTLESMRPNYVRSDENRKILLDYIEKHQAGQPFSATNLIAAYDATESNLTLRQRASTFGATKVTDYQPRQSTSELLNNTKLKKKISGMTADEYRVWMAENESGRAALDALA